ncbi:MAG: pentapeptide repeat-containing protein [Nitrosotalea sp.]
MRTKIVITRWITGSILFEFEKENNTLRDTIVEANLYGADLRGADLHEADLRVADLREANLYEANLYEADLREAKNIPDDSTDFWWHIHHESLYEMLTEPIRARINYIKNNKPKEEIEVRLRLLKPVLGKIPKTEKGWERLHKSECKGCLWNGKTIFPK